MGPHTHTHESAAHQENKEIRGFLKFSLFVSISFFVAELIIAISSGSIAVLGDSLHNLSHALVLIFSLFGLSLANKPPTNNLTYGLRRLEFLVPTANAVFLSIIGMWLIMEGRFRLVLPQEVSGIPIITVSSLDIAADIFVVVLMAKCWGNLTAKTVLAHLFFDSLASVSVIFGGILIALWDWYYADAYAAMFIGGFAVISSLFILWRMRYSLVDGVPSGVSLNTIRTLLLEKENITAVHDLHVWSIAPDHNILTAHILVKNKEPECLDSLLKTLSQELNHKFKLAHLTIQYEFQSCKT